MIKTVENKEIEKQYEYMEKIKDKVSGLKYYINTMGCKLNENDSEKISGMLTQMGYIETTKFEDANLVVFNTCCIRENAEEKVFGNLGELKNIKAKNNMIICFAGCMSQEPHVIEKIKKSYSQVDIIFGTHNIYKFPEMLYNKLDSQRRIFDVWNIDGEIFEGLPIKRNGETSASVTIMNGCNNFCAYCIVPYTRGRERSRSPRDILREIEELAKEGYNEIMLLGQNVNSYNGGEGYGFANLLRDIDKIEGINIVRFMSPHPKDFTDNVIDAIAECNSICKVIHLPLQSGSSNVLKLMNRRYTKESYLELVDKIRAKIPNVAFTTDIIVGFPGETEEDFADTLDVVKKVKYEQVFMFIYSVRKGTKAETMPNHVPEEVKSERFGRLKALADKLTEEENMKYIGTIQDVLVEGESKNNKDMLSGRTRTNKVVIFEGDKELIGKEIKIKITSQHIWFLRGSIVKG
ncbi:MAG: tRNA (N6-isopentenyl adenosine(37)-C2)-methylthiotransferase MiaB [Clostridia bacterium]|nr:tRNA (N6-isopentenyl adenosine(37)-C2)-methylthiotransferase MiaB [Clostridia bacterium]